VAYTFLAFSRFAVDRRGDPVTRFVVVPSAFVPFRMVLFAWSPGSLVLRGAVV